MGRDYDDDDVANDDDGVLCRYQDNSKAFVYLLDLFLLFFRKYSDLHKYKIRYLSNKYSM